MNREFIIGAMNLTPYFVRTERGSYIFRDVPIEILRSLVALSHWDARKVAVYISPKIYFSTTSFTSEPYHFGIVFRAYSHGDIYGFVILSEEEARHDKWAQKDLK